MQLLHKPLLDLVFSGAHLLRWNDKLRPAELMELDKQGHKMLVACALCHEYLNHNGMTDLSGKPTDEGWAFTERVIEGGLFDYFYRAIITDIKPPVFYRIRTNKKNYEQLTEHVFNVLSPVLEEADSGFWNRFREWHTHDDPYSPERRILEAAHRYASQWEFNLIRPMNPFDEEMPRIAKDFDEMLHNCRDLPGMSELLYPHSGLYRFANICGQLRFQIRWTQVPRVPSTSVLGHMFIVAVYAYFFALKMNTCLARRCNDFFCGLFHDLPEVLTRDIISPVKKSVTDLSDLIHEIEEAELEERIFSPLRESHFESLVGRIRYYLGADVGSEFAASYRTADGAVLRAKGDFQELNQNFNSNDFDAKDGSMIKICDLLAAFMEAYTSMRNGVTSQHLNDARSRLSYELAERPSYFGLDGLLREFQ